MRNILLFLALLFCVATPAFAQKADANAELNARVAQMSDSEKARLLQKLDEQPVAQPSSAAATAREWADIGKGVGQGLAATAKELGVVANDFVKTPVGKLTAGLIIWNYAGDQILSFVKAILLLLGFGIPTLVYGHRMFGQWEVVKNAKGAEKLKFAGYSTSKFSSEAGFVFCLASVLIFVAFVAIL